MAGAAPPVSTTQQVRSASTALVIFVVALFFIWGGATSLNDILIPKLKGLFQLSYTEAMLIQFAFFTAYAIISLPAGFLVARLGYGKGIVMGLSLMAMGCLLFIPAAFTATYALFLGALFVLAGGITILQVAANPLIANLGSPETSHSRLTFAQAFNSLGTTVWPYVGAQIVLGSITNVDPATLSGEALVAFQAKEAAVISNTYLGITAMPR
jgi:FHS family L-fucose permease-like MFS transporter